MESLIQEILDNISAEQLEQVNSSTQALKSVNAGPLVMIAYDLDNN